MKKKNLTNEELSRHFDNPFDLVNHAIHLAQHLIRSGHELTENQDRNSAAVVLKKVLREQENQKKSKELADLESKGISEDKSFPDPLLQAI